MYGGRQNHKTSTEIIFNLVHMVLGHKSWCKVYADQIAPKFEWNKNLVL